MSLWALESVIICGILECNWLEILKFTRGAQYVFFPTDADHYTFLMADTNKITQNVTFFVIL